MVASSAGHTRLDSHAVAYLDILHLLAHLDDGARALMAENDGALEDEIADPPPLPVVYIATADACLFDVDADIVFVAKGWDRTILKMYVLD